jgi:hypothetical protein
MHQLPRRPSARAHFPRLVLYRTGQLPSTISIAGSGDRQTKLGGSDVRHSLVERIPEHGDHNFLRAGFHDICASYVSISPKSDRSRSLSDCRRIILSDEISFSGHGWRALGRRSLQFPDQSFGCKVGSDLDALSPGVTMLGTVTPSAPLLTRIFGEIAARQ